MNCFICFLIIFANSSYYILATLSSTPILIPDCHCHKNGTNWDLTNVSNCQFENFTCVCEIGYIGKRCDMCQSHFYNSANLCVPCPCLLSQSDGSCYVNNSDNIKCTNCLNGFTGDLCNECLTKHYLTVDESGKPMCIPCNCSNVQKIYEEEKNCDKKLMMECFTCLTFEHRNKCSPFGYETNSSITTSKNIPSNKTALFIENHNDNYTKDFVTSPSSVYTITLSVIVVISLTITAFILVTVILFIIKSKRKNKFIWYHYLHPESEESNPTKLKTQNPYASHLTIIDNDELQLSHDANVRNIDKRLNLSIDPYSLVDGLEHLKNDNPYRFSHDQNTNHMTKKPILGFLLR